MPLPELPREYSATLVRSDGDRIRIAIRTDRRRVENNFKNGHRHVVIVRGDLGVGWIWQNADPWLETPMDPRSASGVADPSLALAWTEMGAAEIEGESCRHFAGSRNRSDIPVEEECFVLPNGIRRRTITYRLDGTVGIVIDCLDVTVGPPQLEAFELPAGAIVGRTRRRRAGG